MHAPSIPLTLAGAPRHATGSHLRIWHHGKPNPNPNPNPNQGSHPFSCDKSGQCPIVGWRFKLTGQDYDLCEAEFNKLPDAEKERYQKIAAPGTPLNIAAQKGHEAVRKLLLAHAAADATKQ